MREDRLHRFLRRKARAIQPEAQARGFAQKGGVQRLYGKARVAFFAARRFPLAHSFRIRAQHHGAHGIAGKALQQICPFLAIIIVLQNDGKPASKYAFAASTARR